MQSSDRNMNWSSLTLLSCYIPLIHTPLCCKTLEQHFVHLPSFVCILPHFSLTKHSFLWRQGYYYNPPFTDRKIETLKRLDDNLPSHIFVQTGTENRFLGGGERILCHLTNTTSKIMPLQLQTCDSTCPQETLTFFFSQQIHSTALWLGGGSFITPGGPNNPPCPQAVLTLSLLSGALPLLPFPLMHGRALETMASSWPHLRTAHWCKPQHVMRASIFYH